MSIWLPPSDDVIYEQSLLPERSKHLYIKKFQVFPSQFTLKMLPNWKPGQDIYRPPPIYVKAKKCDITLYTNI